MFKLSRIAIGLLLLSLGLHLLTAWHSSGIFNTDEHFQIFEYLNYKLGRVPAVHLPWEFRDRARPWLQPAMYYGLLKTFQAVGGAFDPFRFATFARFFSAVIGWLSLVALFLSHDRWFKRENLKLASLWALSLFYFFPFFHARTSSENLGASFLAFAVALLTLGGEGVLAALGTGLLLGLAFEFRFHLGIGIVGLVAWLVFVRKINRRYVATLLLGVGIAIIFAAAIDRWGFGEWCFPPWNYFRATVMQGVGNQWGTDPWWFYFLKIGRGTLFGLGFLIVGGWLFCWVRLPKGLFTWITLPYLLVHALVAHKEIRFLFPIFQFSVIGFFLALETLPAYEFGGIFFVFKRVAGGLILFVNFVALFRVAFSPLTMELLVLQEIYRLAPERALLFYNDEDPDYFLGAEQTYYAPKVFHRRLVRVHPWDADDLRKLQTTKDEPVFLFLRMSRQDFKEFSSVPGNCTRLNIFSEDGGILEKLKFIPSIAKLNQAVIERGIYHCKILGQSS